MIGQTIAEIAKKHAGCSAHQNQALYLDVILRPSDDNPRMRNYYAGSTPPSTCALFALGCLRLAGFKDSYVAAPYQIGQAVTDVVRFGGVYKAWKEGESISGNLKAGSVIIIYGKYAEHVMVCVSDSKDSGNGTFVVETVEGGQSPDSSGIKLFTRQISKVNGKWCVGTSKIIGVVDSASLPETELSMSQVVEYEAKKEPEVVINADVEEVVTEPKPEVAADKPVEDAKKPAEEIVSVPSKDITTTIGLVLAALAAMYTVAKNLLHC